MRQRSQQIIAELKAALAPNDRTLVNTVPLVVDDGIGEVNAFAACLKDGRALMAISDGLMEIIAQMARARATDQFFGGNRFAAYLGLVARHQKPKRPIVRPQTGFFNPQQDADGRKVRRQHQLFDEQIAFVLGHELAHHYLRHTGCLGRTGGISLTDIGRVLSNAVPGFNQPNEAAADVQGVNNLLNAGKRRSDYRWTEGGARMVLDFFLAMKKLSPAESILFAFEISHPHPSFRIPIVQNTANMWRASGGRSQGMRLRP